ncbi:MAG: hypothetical protein KAI47_03220, partial [Deltaproteobacteria bacterium]|nr:hypothetical protein [Deltaproteobacteria bacterium]
MRRSIGCSWRFWGALFLLSSFSWIGACQGPEALTRPQTVEGETFGAKFFTLACQRVAYTSSLAAHAKDPSRPIDVSGSRYRFACRYGPKFLSVANAQVEDPKVAALFARRDDFIKAIDLIFPGSELTELQAYMVKILDLTDDGRFPAVVEKSAAALDLFRADLSVNQALARVESRLGYRPRSVALGILREALNYPKLKETLDCFLSLVGEGGKGEASFKKLTEALSYELRTARRVDDPTRSDPVHPGSSLRTLRLGLDLLFASDPAFASGTSHWLVARDWRGVAQVRRTSTGVASPFVDKDGDGLADVDNLGYLVTTSGAAPPRPFHHDPQKPDLALVRDSYGRALDATGNPLYVYRDLDATLLGALVRDSAQLVDPIKDTALKALEGLIAILGPRKAQTRKGTKGETIAYQGFDSAASPILDLAYAGLTMLRDPAILGTLEGLKTLMVDHEPEVARSIAAMRRSSDIADKYPARNVDSRSTLYDELFILLRQMVNTPGLLEDVLASMKDPRTKNLDRMFANYFKYADVHVLGSGDKVVSQSGGSTLFSREVDRSKPDSGANRSMQQRLFHVVHDTNGMRICSKAGAQILVPSIMSFSPCKTSPCKECDLFQVDNGAVFYMQSMVFARDATGKLTTTRKATLRLKTEKMTALVAAAITGLGTDLILKTMTEIDGMGAHPT